MVIDQVNLGSRTLYPGRELLAGHEHIHIGKRAIQILSVLARAHGETVTKQELLDEVWPDTTVEENTLPVHVVALRKALGPEAGRLKTVHGIGYRLDIDPPANGALANGHAGVMDMPERPDIERRTRIAGLPADRPGRIAAIAVAAAAIGLTGYSMFQKQPQPVDGDAPLYVAEPSASGGEKPALIATEVDGAVKNAVGKLGLALLDADGAGAVPADAELVLTTKVAPSSGGYAAHVSLEHGPNGTVLWSRSFEAKTAGTSRMAEQIGASVARTIYTMREARGERSAPLDAETMALHLRGSEILRNRQVSNDTSASEIFRQVVRAVPKSAPAHALLAISLQVDALSAPPDLRKEVLAELRQEARKAIAIEPAASGAAYDALAIAEALERPQDLANYENAVLAGIAAAPDFSFLQMRECRFLLDTGFEERGQEYCRRAVALHPYAEPILHTYARALATTNQPAAAARFIDRAAYLFPDHLQIQRTRFELALFQGRPEIALRILDSKEDLPPEITPEQAQLWRRYIAGFGRWPDTERAALAARIVSLFNGDKLGAEWAAMALSSLGKESRAIDLLLSVAPQGRMPAFNAQFLFQPVTRTLRAQPGFWVLADRLGLVRYWREKGVWPDFCSREMTIQKCRESAQGAILQRGQRT